MELCNGIPAKGVLACIAGFLACLVMGSTSYTFPLVSPYLTGYLRNRTDSSVTYGDFANVLNMYLVFNGLGLALGGIVLMPKLGARPTMVIGGTFLTLSSLLTTVTIDQGRREELEISCCTI